MEEKKFATGEFLSVTCLTKSCRYFITKSSKTGLFYLYKEIAENNLKKIDKGRKNPIEFDDFIWADIAK